MPALYFLFNVNTSSLLARGEVRNVCGLILLAGMLSILLNVLLIPDFGFVGSAMAYAGAWLIPALFSFPMMVGKLEMFVKWTALARPLVVSAMAAGAVAVARWLGLSNEIALIAVFPLACAALYLLTIDADDRRLLNAFGSFVSSEKATMNWRRKEKAT